MRKTMTSLPLGRNKNHKSLTLQMIDNDSLGSNLKGPYSTWKEHTIESKTAEYNGLSGEENDASKLIRKYRVRKLGLIRGTILNFKQWRAERTAMRLLELKASYIEYRDKVDAPSPLKAWKDREEDDEPPF